MPAGTGKLLETISVPAVPVVPAQKTEAQGNDARMRENSRHNFSSIVGLPHASTIQHSTFDGNNGNNGNNGKTRRKSTTYPFPIFFGNLEQREQQ
jgi:hypothetical protein